MVAWDKPNGDWLESKCRRFRIIRHKNESKVQNVWPLVYILWDLSTKPATLVGPFETAPDAKEAAEKR
jgi:hypothetical protein